jgi:hypothetical protein
VAVEIIQYEEEEEEEEEDSEVYIQMYNVDIDACLIM